MEPMRELNFGDLNITCFRDSKGRVDVDIYSTDRFGDEQLASTLDKEDAIKLINFLKEAFEAGLAHARKQKEAPEGSRDMLEWQPIETAPKDSTAITIYSVNHGILHNYNLVVLPNDNKFYDPCNSGVICIRDATHWMPLPEPPEEK